MTLKKIKIKKKFNKTGSLLPIEFNKIYKKSIKRIFFLEPKKNCIRGNHAHKKCTQIIMVLKGKIKLELHSKQLNKILTLHERETEAYIIKPRTWIKITGISKYNLVAVLCDQNYKEKDYIIDFKNL